MAQVNFKFLANTKGLEQGIKKGQKSLTGFEKSTKKISGSIGKALGGLGLAMGIGALVSGLKDATKAAQEDLKSQKLLALQLKTTTNATDDQLKSTEAWLSSLSMAVGIADDDLRPALANAVRGTGNLKDAQKLLTIALDGSAASGKPLDSVLQALIKANNGNKTSLYKLAPQLKKTKGGIDDYAKSVKNAAKTSADPFSKMQVALDEVKEKVGNLVLPAITEMVDYITQTVVPGVQDFLDQVNDPNTDAGQLFIHIKDLVKKIFDYIVKIGTSDGFEKTLGTAITLATKLLDLIMAISDIMSGGSSDTYVPRTSAQALIKNKMLLGTFGGQMNIYGVKKLAAKVGKTLSTAQAKRAIKDQIGGADGNPLTPWPMAKGGIVMPRAGGTLAQIGEAGKPEAVIPLDRFGGMFGGNSYTVNVNKANMTGEEIVRQIKKFEIASGRKFVL
jgi:hypothetical protein